MSARVALPMPAGMLVGSLSEKNLPDPEAVLHLTRDTLNRAGFKGFELTVVLPDDSSRIAFVTVDSLAGSEEDKDAFVRWKLKKSMPFDVDAAQIAYSVLGPHEGAEGKGVDVMVALSPRSVVREYEDLFEKLDLHAGRVLPSTLAALSLLRLPAQDSLFIKSAPGSVTTTVFRNQRPRFYRRMTGTSLYDAAYPTVLYYQDKLGGDRFADLTVCGYDQENKAEIADLESKLGIPVRRMEPRSVEDIFKPVFGALDLVWTHLT